ncbi:hypothetical protein DH2020_001171 [Rehmannia glutinosa]|uniref:Uncharacterized protein n=1 Tax=Rehmannia glutinosa TaxID=99300 RepID=A0ABR0XYK1_REHGL
MEAIAKKVKAPTKPSFRASVNNGRIEFNTIPPPKPQYPSSSKPPLKLLSSSEMAARREKGLCYNCDEAFVFGHRCKNRVTYMIMTEDEELSYMQDHKALEQEVEQPNLPMEEVQMSLNAITGEDGITTMRLVGDCNGHKLHILIDSGSTLSFIQETTARKLGCDLEVVKPLLVKVANGQRMVSSQRAKGFSWKMQGHTFAYPLRVLQNEGCDLIRRRLVEVMHSY